MEWEWFLVAVEWRDIMQGCGQILYGEEMGMVEEWVNQAMERMRDQSMLMLRKTMREEGGPVFNGLEIAALKMIKWALLKRDSGITGKQTGVGGGIGIGTMKELDIMINGRGGVIGKAKGLRGQEASPMLWKKQTGMPFLEKQSMLRGDTRDMNAFHTIFATSGILFGEFCFIARKTWYL
uniref:Uncharacterized protein n=1 Tax=Picea sitchensis TaxID=3332 RepID=D5A876_PICSI|nr:unknown [Picea sitchensis]